MLVEAVLLDEPRQSQRRRLVAERTPMCGVDDSAALLGIRDGM